MRGTRGVRRTPVPAMNTRVTSSGTRLQLLTDQHRPVSAAADEKVTDYKGLVHGAEVQTFFGPGHHEFVEVRIASQDQLRDLGGAARLERSELPVSDAVRTSQPVVQTAIELATARSGAASREIGRSLTMVGPGSSGGGVVVGD